MFCLAVCQLHFSIVLGTENPADDDDRKAVAVDEQGGSYVITQRWIHNLDLLKNTQGMSYCMKSLSH